MQDECGDSRTSVRVWKRPHPDCQAGCHAIFFGCPWQPPKLHRIATACLQFAFTCTFFPSLLSLGFQFPTLSSGGWKLATSSSPLLPFTAVGRRTFLNACAAIDPESRTRTAVPYQPCGTALTGQGKTCLETLSPTEQGQKRLRQIASRHSLMHESAVPRPFGAPIGTAFSMPGGDPASVSQGEAFTPWRGLTPLRSLG
jgi:hypothetical protein